MSIIDKYKKYQLKSDQPLSTKTITIPNLLSFLRIVMITPFVVFFLYKQYLAAAIVIALSGLTDLFDGWIARNFNQMSELGKILDPLADKLTLVAVGVCMIFLEPFLIIPMAIMVVKDLLMLIGGIIIIKRGIIPPPSKWYGKVATFMFYIMVAYVVVDQVFSFNNQTIVLILVSSTTAFMLFAFISYFILFFQLMREITEVQNEANAQEEIKDKIKLNTSAVNAEITQKIPKLTDENIEKIKEQK